MTEIVKEIEMPFWQNPQCYVFTEHQRDDVWVYFDCLDDNREKLKNVLGKITFISCFEVHIKRGVRKYLPEEPLLRSSLDEVINSKKINKYTQHTTKKRKSLLKQWHNNNFSHEPPLCQTLTDSVKY